METVTPEKTNSFKNFVVRHKVAIAVTATAATCLWLNRMSLRSHDNFLKEHDLYNDFYTPDEDE